MPLTPVARLASGRAITVRCRCPKCRGEVSRVVNTGSMADGRMVRERRCQECDHRWFTVQEPEFVVPRDQVRYERHKPVVID